MLNINAAMLGLQGIEEGGRQRQTRMRSTAVGQDFGRTEREQGEIQTRLARGEGL